MSKPACQAIVDDRANGDRFNLSRLVIVYPKKGCSRRGVERVGHLLLCATHARLAREGFVMETGQVAPARDIRDARRFPKQFPGGLYSWVK